MRIAILSRYQGDIQRGAETFVQELTLQLSKIHEVVILSGKDADSLSKIFKGKFDVVIPINGRLQALKVSWGRMFGGYKVLISGHSGIGKDDYWNLLVVRPNIFVALTQNAFEWAKKYSIGVKVVKIPNGIDLKRYTPVGKKFLLHLEKPIILSVGALVWYKHHEKVIEAVSQLRKGSLLIVGEGEDKQKLESLGKKKLGERFEIMEAPYDEMPKIYRSVDLFTLPSWDREAFGIVYLEALASNVPVVAPNDSSRKEIVGKAGILVDVDNPQEYRDALLKVLNEKWKDLPRKQAEKFSWEEIAKEYCEVIEEMNK